VIWPLDSHWIGADDKQRPGSSAEMWDALLDRIAGTPQAQCHRHTGRGRGTRRPKRRMRRCRAVQVWGPCTAFRSRSKMHTRRRDADDERPQPLADYVPERDAVVVDRMRAAGPRPGKTNMPGWP